MKTARLAAIAGPALIVASVLFVLHDVAFGGMVTSQHEDVLNQRLPDHCYLGRNLADGNLPTWNPHVLGGTPFAADPQSGWLLAPAMALYTVLPCGVAAGWYFVLQPILAGLGVFWFLRGEGASRPAATVGGLALSVGVSASLLVASLPFSGTIAWTAVTLAAASRYLRAETWAGRIVWLLLTSLAWGQLAATHLSNGLALGTGALAVFLLRGVIKDVGRGTWRLSLGLVATLLVALPLVNLAILLPRLAYLPRTSISLGYERLLQLNATLPGRLAAPFEPGLANVVAWPLKLVTSPGTYLGAVPLALALGGLWSRRHRSLAVAFAVYAAASYLLSLRPVAEALAPVIRGWPLADFYLHRPWRFGVGTIVAVSILGGLGVEAWREEASLRRRLSMLIPGLGIWGLGPFLVGANPDHLALAGLGAVAGALALGAAVLRPAAIVAVPVLLAAELSANALIGQGGEGPPSQYRQSLGLGRLMFGTVPLHEPTVPAAKYLEPGPIARAIREGGVGRYATAGGYVYMLDPAQWPALAAQRAILFGLEDAQGYNPVQLRRYWTFVRSANSGVVKYNIAIFTDRAPSTLDLLQIRWLVAPAGENPGPAWEELVREEGWVLYERPEAPPRASLVTEWSVVGDPQEALAAVTDPSFDPREVVLLEGDPGIEPAAGTTGSVTYEALGPDRASLRVEADGPAIVLIRNTHDPNWRATLDGRPVPVLRADWFLQAVAVPPGTHTVDLDHDDPWIDRGLALSAIVVALLVGAAGWLNRRDRRRVREAPQEPGAEVDTESALTGGGRGT